MPRPPKPRSQPTRLRKGAIAVIGALLAVLLLSCAALMIDISYIQLTGIELQSAADAAALAGVTKLPTSNDAAVAEAKSFATKNVAASQSVILANSDVEFGYWTAADRVFHPSTTIRSALRVTARRESGTTQGPLALFFAPILGVPSVNIKRSAVAALRPVPTAEIVPMALRGSFWFGPVDPKIWMMNPGKDGPSYPTHPVPWDLKAYYLVGDQVTVSVFGQGVQAPVQITLDLPNFNDEAKVLKGDVPPQPVNLNDTFLVFGDGQARSNFINSLADRVQRYPSDHPIRTVLMPVVMPEPDARDSSGELSGHVRIVDFATVHLDAIVDADIPKPSDPSRTVKVQLLTGTIARTILPGSGTTAGDSTFFPDPSVGVYQLAN